MGGLSEICRGIVFCANCHAKRHYNHYKVKLFDLGADGDLERCGEMLYISEKEDFAYCAHFGITSTNVNPDPIEYAGMDALW